MSSITEKVWGTTECVLDAENCKIHRLIIKPNHRCSDHRHGGKANWFYVISGRLFIDVMLDDGSLSRSTELGPGASTVVSAVVRHQFRTGTEPCEALEAYYHEPLSEDIERFNQGGPVAHHPV